MSVPGWWAFLLLGLAAFRIYRLLGEDTILDRPRGWLLRLPTDWREGQRVPDSYRDKWGAFITCPWCAGFWITLLWWAAWQIWPHGTLVVAALFALSTIVGLLARLDDDE